MSWSTFASRDEEDKKKRQLTTSNQSVSGWTSFAQKTNPSVLEPKKVEHKPIVSKPKVIKYEPKTPVKPVKESFMDKAKKFAGKVIEKTDDLLRGKPKTISPIPTDKYEEMGFIETSIPQFKAGTGDMLVTMGSTARWLGKDGVADKLTKQGVKYQKSAVPTTTGEFDWKDLYDPAFYSQTVMRSVPFTIALIPAAIAGAYGGVAVAGAAGLGALGTTILGAIGATALSRPLESALEAGSAYDEALQKGKSQEEADKSASKTFKGNLALSGMDVAEFATAFLPLKGGGRFIKALKRTAGIAGGIAMEGSEELIQRNIQKVSMGEDIDITSKEAQQEFALGGIMGGGMSVAGAIYTKIQGNVQEEYKDEYEEKYTKKIEEGLPPQTAHIKTLDEITEAHPEEVAEIVESTLEETVIPPQSTEPVESQEEVVAEEVKPTESQVVEPIVGASEINRPFNEKNTKEAVDAIMAGEKEEDRLDNPQNIKKFMGLQAQPTDTVMVYRAGAGDSISEGSYVTTSKERAEKVYQGQRKGSQVIEQEVPISDLVYGGGLKSEYVYSPKTEIEGSTTAQQDIAQSTESDIIESDDNQTTATSPSVGREPGSRELPSASQVGAGESRYAGKPGEKPSRQVARRERDVSDSGSGNRSGTSVKESARNSAKDLISAYVKRGDTIKNLKDGQMGYSSPDGYSASIGGYIDGKKIPNDKIIVSRIDGVDLEKPEIFSLKELYDEIKTESVEEVIESEIPQEVQSEIEEQIVEAEGDSVKEEAIINIARHKATEYTEPVIQSPKKQVDINKQIEELMASKVGELTESEKKLVKQYSGAGGLESAGAEGRGLLDEYFTPKPIVDFMWDKVIGEMQVTKESTIVEPSVGIGAFLERVPRGARKIAFEINPTSASITRALHGDNLEMNVEPFESLFMDKRGKKFPVTEFADVVIGNPPYGEHRGKYLGLGEEPKIVKYEEYFMKRGMDILKPDGVMAFVVPSGFLRSTQSYAKIQIAKQGKLLLAYRLPEGSFGTTTIGTDILVFQKNTEGITEDETLELLRLDNYFSANPQNVLGKVSKGTGRYGQDQVIGSLESAIKMAQKDAVQIEDSMTPEEIQEDTQAIVQEVEQTIEETKSEPVETSRAPVINKANKEAQIIPNKKDKTIKLNSISPEEAKIWQSVNVTGELNSSFTANFNPKTFVSDDIAVEIHNGEIKYYPNIIYYQGDIYDKLDWLELAKDKINKEQYTKQKSKLLEVLPMPQTINDVTLSPIADFVKDIKFTDERGQSRGVVDMFKDYIYGLPSQAFGSSSAWEVRGFLNGQIVNTGNKLQNIEVRKRRRSVTQNLFKRFTQEILTDEQKNHIIDRYNRTFNAYYRPDYKQVPILSEINATFKGKPLEVKGIQKEGAAFLATRGTGLLGYDVGVGKTLTSIIAINDVLKRGWAKKPLVVVPNGVYKNWIKEISELIPNVKINDLNNLGAGFKGDLKTLEIEDGTVSVITYSGLVKLGFKDETYQSLTVDLQDVMSGMNTTARGKEKQRAQVEATVGRAIRGTTDSRYFEDLGFDHLTIDEVHNFKNIFAGAKIAKGTGNEFRNVRGSSSARGIKAYLMAQYVMKNNNDRNVFLLSATPFTNSPLEIYSIMSLMGKRRLEQIGLKNVNDFMTMFMELKPTFVIKADQSVKEEDVIEKFQNLQEMQKLVTEFIDFRTGEEAGVDRPSRVKKTIPLNTNKLQADYIVQAQPLFTDKENGGAIVAITELQNITLSPYLSRFNSKVPSYKEFVENSPKVKYAIEGIAQNRKDNKNAGQVLYMPRGIEFFPLVKEYLIKEKGFKASEIGQITGGMSLDARMKVQDGFNNGDIKVLFGTEAVKEGVNLQERATDLFHLHLPWNPTDMLQVEGRIWRQGNKWKNVRIHYPLIENSVDSFIFQKLETKEKRIRNLWSYKENEISVGDLNFEDMKLDLITDPVLRVGAEKTFETSKQRTKLEQLRVEFAFTERRRQALQDAKDELQQANESYKRIQEAEDVDENRLEYYKNRVTKVKKELSRIQNVFKANNMTEKDLDSKSAELTKQIEAQNTLIQGLDEKFKAKLEQAQNEKVEIGVKENNFKTLASEIGKENKTFFVKKVETKTPSGDFKLEKRTPIENYSENFDPAKSPEDFKKKIEQLNKFAQANAILRRTGGLKGRRAVGQFVKPGSALFRKGVAKEGQVRLRAENISNDAEYVSILAHELGHAIEYHITGETGKRTFDVFGKDLDIVTVAKIKRELMAITEELEGAENVKKDIKYFEKPSELLARFFEKLMISPNNLEDIAPTVNSLIERQRIKHPMLEEFLEAVHGEIDKGAFSKVPDFYKDLRQTYQKHLGKRVGNIVYGEELAHRAMTGRAKKAMEDLVKEKFKNVKDDSGLLFRVAESIKITKGGVPEFGTRDFAKANSPEEEAKLKELGFEKVDTQVEGDTTVPVYARQRYTEVEGRAMFNKLSKEGKQLILDFTASRDEAKDYFNREIIKDVHKVEGNIEGWVHHYFEAEPQTKGGIRLRLSESASRKKRTGKEGYVEDFKKAMTKALVDLELEKVTNDFLPRFFASVTKPIPEGHKPDNGWVEVMGTLEKGVGMRQEKTVLVVKDGRSFIAKQTRYQMPKNIYERYRLWKGLADEASLAVRVMSDINRYWRINILAHPGTAATNFNSGAIQYATKVMTDFYKETLTGSVAYKQTRQNVSAMLKVLTPKGWNEAQDWVYGADLSNYYGQFTEQPTTSKAISSYGDKALKLFSLYERYWKKVIATAEGVQDLQSLTKLTKEGLRLPTKEERMLLAEINKEVDLYAYDYDNIPVWLARFGKNPLAQSVKPFAVYPYKYAKQVTNMVGSVFDRSLSWQERSAKLLTITTMVALYALYADERKRKQQTPEGTPDTPVRLSPRGRLFVTEKDGKELFVRVAKYPFLNLSEAGMQLVNGNYDSAVGLMNEMFGSIAPIGKIGLLAIGYKSPYEQYDTAPVIVGKSLVTYFPGYRILNDVSRMLDPFQRKQRTFLQTLTAIIPTTDKDLQDKLHGDVRTERVPIEGEIKGEEGTKRTTIDKTLKNYWEDIAISMLSGIYISRIDPKDAEAYLIRSEKNKQEKDDTSKIDEYVLQYKKKPTISRKMELERKLIEEIVGKPPYEKDRLKAKKSVRTRFRNRIKAK